MSDELTISPKHGLNPSLVLCPVCGADVGIALLGKLKGDAEAPRQVLGFELCEQCKELTTKGIILLSENRTGEMVVVADEGFKVIFKQEPPQGRVCLVSQSLITKLKEINNV